MLIIEQHLGNQSSRFVDFFNMYRSLCWFRSAVNTQPSTLPEFITLVLYHLHCYCSYLSYISILFVCHFMFVAFKTVIVSQIYYYFLLLIIYSFLIIVCKLLYYRQKMCLYLVLKLLLKLYFTIILYFAMT